MRSTRSSRLSIYGDEGLDFASSLDDSTSSRATDMGKPRAGNLDVLRLFTPAQWPVKRAVNILATDTWTREDETTCECASQAARRPPCS